MADWAPPESDFQGAPSPTASDDASWAPPESDFASPAPDETVGRVAGSYARGLAGGVAGLPETVGKAAETAFNPLSPLQEPIERALGAKKSAAPPPTPDEPYSPQLSDFVHPEKWQKAAEYFAEKGGLPHPSTPTERVANAAGENTPAGIIGGVPGLVSSALGGAGSQTAAEMGAGPIGQTVAGLAAGSLPSLGSAAAAGLRGIVRGGAKGQAAMQANIDAAAPSKTPLTVGQASGNTALQNVEAVQSSLPGGGAFGKLALAQRENQGATVDDIARNLTGGGVPTPTTAGTAAQTAATRTQSAMQTAEDAAYAKVDSLVPPTTPVAPTNLAKTLDDIAGPRAGAEDITALQNPQMQKLREQVASQLQKNGGTLPYDAVVDLRSQVGPLTRSPDGAVRGPAKLVYGAITADRDAAASEISPQAQSAVTDASNLYAQNIDRHEYVEGLINQIGGPEAVYKNATNATKQGASKISDLMKVLNPDEQNEQRATFLYNLGRGGNSGADFSAAKYLSGWKNMAPEAKEALFPQNGPTAPLRNNLDNLESTMRTVTEGTQLKNPSGSAVLLGHTFGLPSAFAVLHTVLTSGASGIATGGAYAMNIALSHALTNPKVVQWLANSTKAPISALPNAVTQLSKMNDPAAQQLATQLQPPPPQISRASGGRVDIDSLVTRLFTRWKNAKKATNESTKPLLHVNDNAIAKALKIAQEHI